jgi:hypothetical protein
MMAAGEDLVASGDDAADHGIGLDRPKAAEGEAGGAIEHVAVEVVVCGGHGGG